MNPNEKCSERGAKEHREGGRLTRPQKCTATKENSSPKVASISAVR